jgi:heme exporter protein A
MRMRLVAEGLCGERGGTELFSGITFVLEAGEGLAVTGPNGAGKSTLLRVLAGLLQQSSGTVTIVNADSSHACDALHFLGPLNAMKEQLTASENLAFWQGFQHSHDSTKAMTAAAALDAVRLPHVADIPFGYLSTGQKRRVAIARLLCVHRPVWLVDEPTSGLDKASEQLFADLAKEHLAQGGLLVAATHLPLGLDGMQNLLIGDDGR